MSSQRNAFTAHLDGRPSVMLQGSKESITSSKRGTERADREAAAGRSFTGKTKAVLADRHGGVYCRAKG